jgi:hypothetical protein
VNMYRILGDLAATTEARDLAEQLVAWHDSMVKHLRVIDRRGTACGDDCPHVQAQALWAEASEVFGRDAGRLVFLQAHGGQQVVY